MSEPIRYVRDGRGWYVCARYGICIAKTRTVRGGAWAVTIDKQDIGTRYVLRDAKALAEAEIEARHGEADYERTANAGGAYVVARTMREVFEALGLEVPE